MAGGSNPEAVFGAKRNARVDPNRDYAGGGLAMAYLYEAKLEATACYLCGTPFAFVAIEQRRRDGKPFVCPNGHSQVFADTLVDNLRKIAHDEMGRRRRAEDDLAAAVRQLKRLKRKKR